MSAYATLNRTVLLKIESTAGTDASPVVGTDAIRVEQPSSNPQLGVTQTNEVSGALDDAADIPNGALGRSTFVMNLKGSGAATTPPEVSAPFQACAMEEEVRAAAVTGTAQAGAAGSITLAAGASSVEYFHVGQPITLTGGTGSGQTRWIVAYNPTTKVASVVPNWTTNPDATSAYSIPAGVRWRQDSTSLKHATIYDYAHRTDGGNSRLNKVLGAMGTWSLVMPVRQPAKITFNFTGQAVEPADVSPPGTPTLDNIAASPWLNAPTYLGGTQMPFNQLGVNIGVRVTPTDNPNGEFGYGNAATTGRRVEVTINPPKDLKSVFDPFTSWLNGTATSFVTSWGPAGGRRFTLVIPQLVFSNVEDQDINQLAHDQLTGRAVGENAGFFLYHH